jgi:hypothetical protein
MFWRLCSSRRLRREQKAAGRAPHMDAIIRKTIIC